MANNYVIFDVNGLLTDSSLKPISKGNNKVDTFYIAFEEYDYTNTYVTISATLPSGNTLPELGTSISDFFFNENNYKGYKFVVTEPLTAQSGLLTITFNLKGKEDDTRLCSSILNIPIHNSNIATDPTIDNAQYENLLITIDDNAKGLLKSINDEIEKSEGELKTYIDGKTSEGIKLKIIGTVDSVDKLPKNLNTVHLGTAYWVGEKLPRDVYSWGYINSNMELGWTNQGVLNVNYDDKVLIYADDLYSGTLNLLPNNSNDWIQGRITNGVYVEDETKIVTKDYIGVNGDSLYCEIQNKNYCFVNIWYFDSNKNVLAEAYNYSSNKINGSSNIRIDMPTETKYIRVIIRKIDETLITTEEIETIKASVSELGNISHHGDYNQIYLQDFYEKTLNLFPSNDEYTRSFSSEGDSNNIQTDVRWLLKNVTYTLSFKIKSDDGCRMNRIGLGDISNTYINMYDYGDLSSEYITVSKTFTITEDVAYSYLYANNSTIGSVVIKDINLTMTPEYVGYPVKYEGGKVVQEHDLLKMPYEKVLWENPTPDNDFTAKTITLTRGFEEFRWIIIYYKNYKDWSAGWQSCIIRKTFWEDNLKLTTIESNGSTRSRNFDISNGNQSPRNKITFYDAYRDNVVDNNGLIPAKIVGIY